MNPLLQRKHAGSLWAKGRRLIEPDVLCASYSYELDACLVSRQGCDADTGSAIERPDNPLQSKAWRDERRRSCR